jgi:hypothetical protein
VVVNRLLPVPLTSVKGDFPSGHYPVRVGQRKGCGEELVRVEYQREFSTLQPELFFSDARRENRAAHRSGNPSMYHRGFGGFKQAQSSMKSLFRLSGTYDVNGEIITAVEEKGLYVNHFS